MRKSQITVYVVKSIYDRKISKTLPIRYYEKEIQVGAAISDEMICDIRDNSGDNISEKNRQYCELTALYWAWKHSEDEYIGISHYRRRFDISSEMINTFDESSVDIIVTVPVINTKGIGYQYGLTHSKQDWDILREEVHKLSPQYDSDFKTVEQQIYFHPYNMFIMRRDILHEYCEWMFPVLFACEERIGIKEDPYQNRYPGFLSERLLNVFLYENKEKYNIYVANKIYLS